jgi:signal transduction histidine kinase/ligand-binding sensor domain-containing protein
MTEFSVNLVMQRTTFFLAYFLLSNILIAQHYPFVHYTPREGLVNNRARFVFQDSKGKLYISTYGGLSIYDGTRFTNYTTTNGLSNDLVNEIVEMGEDSIWIFPNTHRIHCLVKGRLSDIVPADNYIPLVNQVIKSQNGYTYALADEGLFRFENKRFNKIPLVSTDSREEAKTLTFGVESGGKLYILSNPEYVLPGGILWVYDLASGTVIASRDSIHATHLFVPSPDKLWVSTIDSIYELDILSLESKKLILRGIPRSAHLPPSIVPLGIFSDRQKNTWFTTSNGVYRINEEGKATFFTIENGLTTNLQTSIFQDFENNIWFTNEQTGLSKLSNPQMAYYPEIRPGFSASDIFIPHSGDSVWLYDGYHNKMLILDPNGEMEEYRNAAPMSHTARFVAGKSNWLLSEHKIYRLIPSTNNNRYDLKEHFIDSNSTLWFAYGIEDLNRNLVALSDRIVVLGDKAIVSDPLDYKTDQLAIDKKNRVWVASRSNTLFCFQISGTGTDINISLLRSYNSVLPGSSPRSITVDQSGNIWIGTRDKGLFSLHFENLDLLSTKRLSTTEGLSENFISYLFCDKDNNIWACTPSGLDKIQVNGNQFRIENITRSNNLYFPITKIQQTRKGLYWILSSAGIITYNPERPTMNDWKPQLTITHMIMGDTGHIPIPPDHKLFHNQNNLVFHLSAPTFIDEKQTRFSYILEGSGNEQWSEPSTNASINLVNLPAGSYTLRIRGIFLHGLYPNVETSFPFEVLPPWWKTWWFKLIVASLVIGLIILGLRYYIRRKLELQKVILEKKRAIEKERTRIATDMHDDLGAGLSRIKFLSETIGMKKQQHLPIEEEISSIRTYSHEMIDKMGEIVWALNEKNDTLNDLISYTRAYSAEYLEQNGIACHIEGPGELPPFVVSGEFRRNIYLTVKEALHNVVKHAQASNVSIIISIDSTKLSIEIKDDGTGFDPRKNPGSRNGLLNMRKRMEELNGSFNIESGNGTKIKIQVPLNL